MSMKDRYGDRSPTQIELVGELIWGAVKGIAVMWLLWFALVAVVAVATSDFVTGHRSCPIARNGELIGEYFGRFCVGAPPPDAHYYDPETREWLNRWYDYDGDGKDDDGLYTRTTSPPPPAGPSSPVLTQIDRDGIPVTPTWLHRGLLGLNYQPEPSSPRMPRDAA